MIKCEKCSNKLIWGNDFDAEDCGYEFEGIVSFYSCSYCDTLYEIIDNFNLDEKFIVEIKEYV